MLETLGAQGTLAAYAVFMTALAVVATTARTVRHAPRFEEIRRPE
jgi:hypothetical protein